MPTYRFTSLKEKLASPKKKKAKGRPRKEAAAAAAPGAGEGPATVASPTKKRLRGRMGKEAAAVAEQSPNKKSKSATAVTGGAATNKRNRSMVGGGAGDSPSKKRKTSPAAGAGKSYGKLLYGSTAQRCTVQQYSCFLYFACAFLPQSFNQKPFISIELATVAFSEPHSRSSTFSHHTQQQSTVQQYLPGQ